ncbi:hypothetical protein [uncultured Actinomyces sp.]|uniref:hypothetical protein n=1 Tax=uncultured Actinomyces sp. TaxID=249061 RepID=UPI002623B290|nr:hypothetical protein [uncultured Actinomyces sp.]
MVRADDEQQSESTAPQIAAGNPPPTAATDSSPRLTPMPPWLMHWWTPLLLAGILLAAGSFLASIWRMPLRPVSWWTINPYCPPSWPFNYHWPSKDAMALCVTIAGAGFAFSAWQQRSHDNAANAKQAQATAEREDYWKRREHIYQLLGSKNPGLRLSAVALLAELADSAAHSTLLNDTEKQQLQRHIIDTLCLQLRHEGLCFEAEETQEDHAEIQKAITNTILLRIRTHSKRSAYADWSKQEILFTNCIIVIPLKFENIKTDATLNLSGSTFKESFLIQSSTIGQIVWTTARFLGRLDVVGNRADTMITIDGMPNSVSVAQITNATIRTQHPLRLKHGSENTNNAPSTTLTFNNCEFYDTICHCSPHCSCQIDGNSETCACMLKTTCSCPNKCLQYADISITNKLSNISKSPQDYSVTLWKCSTGTITLSTHDENGDISLVSNTIHGSISINIEASANQKEAIKCTLHKGVDIAVADNSLITDTHFPAIELYNQELPKTTTHILLEDNMAIDPNDPNSRQPAWTYSRCDHKIYCNIVIDTKQKTTSSTTHRSTNSSSTRVTTIGNFPSNHPAHMVVRPALASDQEFIKLYHSDSWPSIDTNQNGGNRVSKPTIETLIFDEIKREHVFIIFDYLGPLAIFAFRPDNCERYGTFRGQWRSNATPHVINYIADIRGQGVRPRIFEFAAQKAAYLRSDAHIDDVPTQRALEEFGFRKCGTFTVNDGTQRIAYDWLRDAPACTATP